MWRVKYFRCLSVFTLTCTFLFPLPISCQVGSGNSYPNSMDHLELVLGEDFEKTDTDNTSLSAYSISPTKYPILRPKSSANNDSENVGDYDEAINLHSNAKREDEIDEWETQSDYPYEEASTTAKNIPASAITDELTKFLPSDVVRKCVLDRCPDENADVTTTPVSRYAKIRPKEIDFQRKPFLCRCDESCRIYGDCCYNIVDKLTTNNPWRCNRLQHEKSWVMMISTCHSDAMLDLQQFCTNPELTPENNYTHHLDIPVYSNFTKKIYKNIYCAFCNGVTPRQIQFMEKKMLCSREMDSVTLETFTKRASYIPGRRFWNDLDIYCGIYVTEFESHKVKETIPDIRFCGPDVIDDCPGNSNEKTANLCFSYTQHITTRFTGENVFKNPHCAKCHMEAMDQSSRKTQNIKCKTYLKDIDTNDTDCATGLECVSTRVLPGGVSSPSGGISLLFDFTFAFEESYVGYEFICKEDEIWDYLHQKCHPKNCPKDHILENNVCVEIVTNKNITGRNETQGNGNSSHGEIGEHLVKKCYTILLHENEYEMLDNRTIVFNKTISGALTQLKFSNNEYERWNNTTVSVCARDLHEGFQAKFPKGLQILSVIALGTSVISSLIHITLYILLPKLRNLPGQNLFCLTLSLLVSQLTFLTMIEHTNKILCVSAAIVMHYFFLSGFFWMNIMGFDIWRTFSSEFLVKRQSNDSTRTFVKYSIFAWISPAIIVLLSAIIDFILADYILETGKLRSMVNIVKPLYGHNNLCWINQGLSLLLFFAMPVALIIVANSTLFLLTAQTILKQHREANRVLKSNDSRATCINIHNKAIASSSTTAKKSNEILVKLYWKLALIMGLTWILGFVANSTGWDVFWYLFVFFNGSQGTFIFLAFDFKPKIWNMIKERFGYEGERLDSSQNMKRRGTATSTTSAGRSNTVRRIP